MKSNPILIHRLSEVLIKEETINLTQIKAVLGDRPFDMPKNVSDALNDAERGYNEHQEILDKEKNQL